MSIEEELRIGNATNRGVIKSFYEHGIHVGFGKTYSFSEVEGLELDELILINNLKFEQTVGGHDGENELYCFKKGIFNVWTSESDNLVVFINCDDRKIELNYVHEIQNLYQELYREKLPYVS